VGAIVGEHRLLLGVAPGQWHAMMTAVDRSVSVNWIPHSDYLRELSDAGLVGLSGLLFLHAAMTMAAWRLRRAHPTLLPVAVAIALVGLADISLCRPETAAIDALLLAVTLFGPRSDDGPTTAKSPSIDPRMNPSGSSPTASTRP
jgi:O-antigen ligase